MIKYFSLLIIICLQWHFTARALPVEKVFVKGGIVKSKNGPIITRSFEMSKYEITNAQYAAFLNSRAIGAEGKSKGKSFINTGARDLQLEWLNKKWAVKNGYENHPMVMVNYYGALAFCEWIGGTLPTEAQWLYAAKGGLKSRGYKYAGANVLEEVGWYSRNSTSSQLVGLKRPNEIGIYDMSGNAWEWCLNDTLKTAMDFCVHMGGSWFAGEQPARLEARYGNKPTHFSNSVGFRVLFTDTSSLHINSKNYKGQPWNKSLQQIPGRIQTEWYDLGGEGVAYHDTDPDNNGSGNLNPANGSFLNEFRMKGGVDISYTKSRDIDNSVFNLVQPEMDQLYVGWTKPGEWINYSLRVNKDALYSIGLFYTASGDGEIALLLDGKELTTTLFIPSTRNEKETIDWRNWHHWNKIDTLAMVKLKKGKHVITLKTVSNGNMNYDYLEFRLLK
jgi:hypothetical protein